MKFATIACLVLAMAACALAAKEASLIFDRPCRYLEDGTPAYCPTTDIWNWKKAQTNHTGFMLNAAGCATEGKCDDPSTRDGITMTPLTANMIVHVICASSGCPSNPSGKAMSQTDVNGQVDVLNSYLEPANIHVNLVATRFHTDNSLSTIPAYSNNPAWYYAISEVKQKYAEDYLTNINVFVTGQAQGSQGTLLGIGTFPWDSAARTDQGGLWMNSIAFGGVDSSGNPPMTLMHEVGHNLGLWHTFHGISEVTGCSDPCYERVHSISDTSADLVGDFCADTLTTPTNYQCNNPGGSDCFGTQFGNTDYRNVMAYGPDGCISSFTDSQIRRAHCWTCAALDQLTGCPN